MVGEVNRKPNAGLLNLALNKFPHLRQYANDYAVITAPSVPGDDRQLESYPPSEDYNPIPGKATTELYNQSVPMPYVQNLIAGDMLHHVGAIDDTTGEPVSPTYQALKQAFLATITPEQKKVDQRAYQQQAPLYGGNPPPFDQWMQTSRGDEYIMGLLSPDQADNWKNFYTPQQRQVGGLLNQYLQGKYKTGPR